MSDDEGQSTKRSSVMDNYLYGGDAAKAAAEAAAAEATNTAAAAADEAALNNRRRSKSCEPSKLLEPGQTRIRNTEIERGVRIKHAKSMHSLAADQNQRVQNDKNKLTELNDRLGELVDAIKHKKLANDNLEIEIKKYKEEILNSSDNSLRKQYTQDLEDAKKELNDVSQQSSLSKIRATRSLYELETLRDKFDMEIKLQEKAREKLSYLEQQRAETVHEIGFLRESCENRERSNGEDIDKNERLRQQIMELNMRLDGELETRVDLECKMQTMLEQKKFEEDIANLMRDELEKLFLYHGENKLFDDPSHFYNTELNQIKERIREDFRKMNEYSSQSLREEYEFRYSKTVEEIEIQHRKAEEERISRENEEMHNINNLKQEHLENEEELKNLRLNGFRLSQTLEELRNRLSDQSASYQGEAEMRDAEIAELIEQINSLKIEMSTMLSFSKTLDSEVSVYARLLNERFTQFMSSTEHLVEDEAKFSYDKYKESIFGNAQDEENEMRRKREQEELRKKQRELEQREERLRQLESERERERERERLKKLQELEMEEQRRRQRAEEQRKQLELEEKERIRRQKELDEQNRLRELERRQYELEQETKRIWELEQQRLSEVEEQERVRAEEERVRAEEERVRAEEERVRVEEEEQEERLRQAAYEMEQRRLKEEDERRRIMEEKRREEYELQQRYEEIEQQRLRQLDDELAIQRMEEEHLRTKQQREEEEYQTREQQRLAEIEERKMREREAELRRLEDIIVEEQQRKISLREENTRRVQEEEQLRQRRIHEIEMEKKRVQEQELKRVLREQEQETYQRMEEKRVKEEQQRQWELEQQRMREIEETTIIQQRRQLELEQARRAKEQEQERQRRLEQEREEREKYILEKLKQEQELLELQKRQKLIQEQREREEYELEYRQRQQQEAHAHSKHQVIGIDNISTITKRITEEKHNSTEVFEEEHIERLPIHQSDTIEKQINIQLPDHPTYHNHSHSHLHNYHNHHHSSHNNVISEESRHESNVIDHRVSSNNGHKHVLIVNSYKPKHSNSSNHISPVVSNVHTINASSSSRSQSPPKMRSSCDALCQSTASNQAVSHKTDSMSPKYAIKHKANRYVSGAIGILETSLNGEYIILENLSSNKNVNLKGWYIHRYVPDQNINLIFKFVNDTMLCCGEKLKILSRSCSTKIRSASMYESANAAGHESSGSSASFKPKDKYISDGNEKIIIATNIENWGTYSKFSVTKLINPEGVDKAVLTQSLLRLASSTSNVNVSSPRESSPNMSLTHKQHQHQATGNSSYYYNRAVSNSNLSQRPAQTPSYYEQYSPRTETVSSSTKKTTRTTEHSNSMSHLTTMSSAPYAVDGNKNAHVTRQF